MFLGLSAPRCRNLCLLLPPLIVEGCTDGGAEFRVFGYPESHSVELLHGWEYLAALGQEGEVAYEHEILDARFEGREDGGRTDASADTIQMSPMAMSSRDAFALALLKSDAMAFIGSPGRGLALMSPISRLILRNVTVLGQVGYLLDVIGLQHDAAQSCQGAAS